MSSASIVGWTNANIQLISDTGRPQLRPSLKGYVWFPSPPTDNILAMVIVWRVRGEII